MRRKSIEEWLYAIALVMLYTLAGILGRLKRLNPFRVAFQDDDQPWVG
jgi:hypothetical protein